VQNALEEDGVAIPRNSGALLCGQKNMAESVSEILKTAGVFEGRILTNF
jgi:phage baseplate assembly protein W